MLSLSPRFFFIRLALLVNFITISQGLPALSPAEGWGGVYEDLEWKTQLCCELPLAQTVGSELTAVSSGLSELSPTEQCQLQNATNPESSSKLQTLSGNCLDILCWLEGDQANLICNAKSHRAAVPVSDSLTTVSPQQLVLKMGLNETNHAAKCAGEDTATCSISLHGNDETVSLFISISVNGTSALSPKMLINTYHLRKPDSPVNLYYNVTTEGEVILRWNDTQTESDTISYEVRYSSNSSLHHWEVVKVTGRSWVPLNELSSGIRYMVQVRCQNQFNHWSKWSQTFSFILDVSYIPAEVFTTPGSEVTVYAVFHNRSWSARNAVWMLNGQVEIPESQYKVINEQVSAVTLKADQPGFHTLMCCYSLGEGIKGSIAYAKIYTEGMFNANITCQSRNSKVDTMTCEWNKSPWAMVRFLYRQYKSMCEDIANMEYTEDGEESMSLIKEGVGPGDHRECTLNNLSLFLCYKMWVEVEGGRGKVRSFSVYVVPYDYVKPSPPSDLEAITLPNKTLSVWWKRPSLPVYDMQYELRFVALRGKAEMQWEAIGPLLEPQAEILLEQSCVHYKVQVRCRRLNGSGYWSEWSKSHTSTVYNRKAPKMGPDFWRIIQEDPVRNVMKVTLIFKPVPADPYSCVEGLVILHQASGGAMWLNETTLASFHSFQWREDVHTVTVMSRNALGISTWNSNMTLLRQPKRQCVHSFSAVSNVSCVYLSWTLLSDQPVPQTFVIEWLDLNKDSEQDRSLTERIQWLRVRSTSRDLSLCRRFYGSEEFTLYPVFEDGESEPARCTATRGDPAAYMLLIIIAFLSVVLFVTLKISQNQMRKLMWKDVPNPNQCSWAKGIDFRQIDTIENLFPHPEGLTACPLLLVSESICEVEIIEKPLPVILEHKKDKEVLLYNSADIERTITNSPLLGDSSEPLSLEASSSAATPETSGQSSVTYSTILLSDKPGLLRKQQESLSGSSDEGNFSANNSDISGSFPGGLWDRENHVGSDSSNPRHSSSYNSVEEFSETSEQEYEASESTGIAKDLNYLGMNEEGKDMEKKENEETEFSEIVMGVDSRPLLEHKHSTASDSNGASHSIPYLPQFRTECINPP
ncbi:leptin receptor-like isoform X1 [Myxocyprinus asiaticus]|uniref:leptin receptor-like isoform X1 n=1 Tax=Myxocyprinus asiaticus TaxID=70543 RepID=UPI002221DF82|nr:leptin receptor-like isoform X1 [Myxocyprinus asiaticus]